jgi:NAD dependent epimerase/dehydratase family enzyme
VRVAREWEAALAAASTPSTRKVALRTSMVMSPDRGGIFDVLLGLVRRGLGGSAGDGRQYVSWIHDADFVRAIEWLLLEEAVEGAVNLASPGPLPYADFMSALRRAAGVRVGLPATKWMLEIGAWAMRTDTELVLKSRRVIPERLTAAGFTFDFADWESAAEDLVARWRVGLSG